MGKAALDIDSKKGQTSDYQDQMCERGIGAKAIKGPFHVFELQNPVLIQI